MRENATEAYSIAMNLQLSMCLVFMARNLLNGEGFCILHSISSILNINFGGRCKFIQCHILIIIIQQILPLSKYGHDALDICGHLSSVGSRYPAVYVASYVRGKKK